MHTLLCATRARASESRSASGRPRATAGNPTALVRAVDEEHRLAHLLLVLLAVVVREEVPATIGLDRVLAQVVHVVHDGFNKRVGALAQPLAHLVEGVEGVAADPGLEVRGEEVAVERPQRVTDAGRAPLVRLLGGEDEVLPPTALDGRLIIRVLAQLLDRKSTRLNSSHT